ncbi:MAG: dynamin family protein [Pseudomonadota bacterium]
MKTNMQTFCQEFSKELEPFGEELRKTLSELPPREDVRQIDSTVLGLREVQQRLSTLREKVSNQRTFLLIFGPLKSGKSTLMNALSGAYVSEVSSLPAYPALVYVKNGERQRFEATDYEGGKREFPDNVALTEAVQTDHAQLADAIVAAEKSGEDFDPQRHHPGAIRRMDIEIPAAHLAESGSVLVDTPGLYSHMRFGYDQMTRDFRDTAACAIFVVKTDNLFFEKVFEEFEDLLSCFSRIFLVANIDSSKKDLRPDGTLEPSLESSDPQQIIDSFRSLSMSATLRGAIEDGRLQIYPIDLQKAASRTLREIAADTESEAVPETELETEPGAELYAESEAGAENPAVTGQRGDGFDEFVTDLTGYLNSSDYLHDFMYDTLRLAQDLTAEVGDLVSGDAVAELNRGIQHAQQELERERARLSALEKLEQQDWDEAFTKLRAARDRLLEELTEQGGELSDEVFREQIAAWMETDESWNDLLKQRLNPQLERESERRSQRVLEDLRTQLEGRHAGAEFSQTQLAIFQDAALPVEEALTACRQYFGTEIQAGTPHLVVDNESIPVARTLGDYLLLRSRGRVRQEIFGDDGNRPVPAAVKQKRLSNESLEKVQAAVRATVDQDMPERQRRYADELVDAHVRQCTEALKQAISRRKNRLQEWIGPTESALQRFQQAKQVLERIESSSARFNGELTQLQSQFDLTPESVTEDGVALHGEVGSDEEVLQDN